MVTVPVVSPGTALDRLLSTMLKVSSGSGTVSLVMAMPLCRLVTPGAKVKELAVAS